MPIKRAAFKALRQSIKRRKRNLLVKTKLKKTVKSVRKAVSAKDSIKAQEFLKSVIPTIDKAAQRGLIKKNKAARLKSRLHAAVRKISKA